MYYCTVPYVSSQSAAVSTTRVHTSPLAHVRRFVVHVPRPRSHAPLKCSSDTENRRFRRFHAVSYQGEAVTAQPLWIFGKDCGYGPGAPPRARGLHAEQRSIPCRSQQSWTSPALSGGDAREDALRPCLTYRTLLPTTLADTDATCSRCLTLRGEGTRRVTTIPEISPLAQSFPSVVRLQCLDLTRYLSNT